MSVILITTLFYNALLLLGEIWYWSLFGFKELIPIQLYASKPMVFLKGMIACNKVFAWNLSVFYKIQYNLVAFSLDPSEIIS